MGSISRQFEAAIDEPTDGAEQEEGAHRHQDRPGQAELGDPEDGAARERG